MSIVNRNEVGINSAQNRSWLLTAYEFVEESAAAQSILDGWELFWGITDGGLGIDSGARILEVIAEMSDEYEALLKPNEVIFRMRSGGRSTRREWQVCLEIAERLKTTIVYRHGNDARSYMQEIDYGPEDEVEQFLMSNE